MQWCWFRARTTRLIISREIKEKLPLWPKSVLLWGNELSPRWGVLAAGSRGDQGLPEAGPAREELGFVQSVKCDAPGAVVGTGVQPSLQASREPGAERAPTPCEKVLMATPEIKTGEGQRGGESSGMVALEVS